MLSPRMSAFSRTLAVAAAGLLIPAFSVSSAALADEITITVLSVKALDKADELSAGDFFAKMSMGGKSETSPVVKKDKFKPDWKLTMPASPGDHEIKLELIDKDVAADDPIDINRVDNKRALEFKINTKSCKIEGFSSPYKCGSTITRAGSEKKKAEITFKVTVKEK